MTNTKRSTESHLQDGDLQPHHQRENHATFQDPLRSKTRSKLQPTTVQLSPRVPHRSTQTRWMRDNDRTQKSRLTPIRRRPGTVRKHVQEYANAVPDRRRRPSKTEPQHQRRKDRVHGGGQQPATQILQHGRKTNSLDGHGELPRVPSIHERRTRPPATQNPQGENSEPHPASHPPKRIRPPNIHATHHSKRLHEINVTIRHRSMRRRRNGDAEIRDEQNHQKARQTDTPHIQRVSQPNPPARLRLANAESRATTKEG